ncbi:uncharacterized protein LOC141696245 [Apium graveolens]|uniref:uncharacterized protein LOC141696245 n=1 Tax=Apium graveolens TaxID=4045 RepID=UPI003D7AD5CC
MAETIKKELEIESVDLNLGDGDGYTVISDQQKGLDNALKDVLPWVKHRLCTRHIYSNLRKRFPSLAVKRPFWNACCATHPVAHQRAMKDLQKTSKAAHDQLSKLDPKLWSKAFFFTHSKDDNVENNMSECFNTWIINERSISRGDVDSSNTGKGIVLPASYKIMEYVPGCIAPNCPDIISRVFRLKLDQLMVDIKDKKHFGVCIGVMYVVEFQKRGLPHVHMLIWLDADSKKNLKQNVDNFVSAEIPDPLLDLVGYAAVKEFMIHGPCGTVRTTFDDSGFPMYMRRRTNITVEIRKAELDNQWRKRKRQANDTDEGGIDEINAYFDGRYLCGAESAYRIFGFPIHHRSISVERLQFHLPGDKNCTFRANEALGKFAAREKNKFSKLEVFFYLNSVDVNARKYTYDKIPRFYMWNDGERKWTMRKRGFQIGRLCYVHHSTGEPWFLRLLLTKVRGATSFESLYTVNGVCYSTFCDACKEYGLLDDDKEWHEVLTQASAGGLPPQVRQLFVHIIVNCKVTDLKTLRSTHWKSMVDDILLRRCQSCPNTLFTFNDMQLQFYALGEIDELIRSVGKSLKKFDQLPQPPRNYLNNGTNNLIIEETSYDTRKMEYETAKLLQDCTEDQRKIYDAVIQSIDTNVGGIFFVYGSRGCGKTFLWRTLICKLHSQGKIMLPVTSSGIAATLMPGGRTAHSSLKFQQFLMNVQHIILPMIQMLRNS